MVGRPSRRILSVCIGLAGHSLIDSLLDAAGECTRFGEHACLCLRCCTDCAGGVARRWSGASEAFKSPTSVAALTGALFGRSSRSGTGGVQLATNRSLRGTPEDQV